MKRPSKAVPLDPDSPHSAIYLAARREWNERYGDYISQAHNWRLIAIAALGVAAIAVAGNVWQSSQSRVQPFVVEVDKLGDALAVQRADIASPIPVGVIRAQLARYIQDVRSVSIDVQAERAFINEAFAMVDKNGSAFTFLNNYFTANDPFTRAASETVFAHVESVLPLPGSNTWRIEWSEDTVARDGRPEFTKHWEATITVSINPPTTDAAILVNPTGLFVEASPWGERQ
jgi:type IV secretory pathway TrbF-like protein